MDSTMNSVQSTVNEGKTGKYERKINNKGEKLRSDSVSSDMVVTTGDAGMALASTRKENTGSTESEGTKDWSYPVISTTGANTHLLQHTTSNTHVTRSRQCDQPKKFSQQQQRSKEEGNDDTGRQQTFPGEGKHNRRGRMEGVRVPDGGWGWLVAMASFFITMLFLSLGQCFGVLFSGYLLELGTSSAITGWIYNIMWLIWHLIGPLLRPLTKEFGWRRIGYLGVFLVSSSIIMSAFSPSAEFLFFSYSLITGVGGGLVGGISFIIVPMYFDRRQGLANTFLTVGICMGQIIITPLVQYLIAEYGFKGATVIYGAILMNGYVAVSFFHPLKWHMKTLRQGDINPPQGDINPPQGDINPPQEGLTPLMQQTKCTDNQGELMDPLGVVLKDEGPKWASVVTQRRAMQVYGEGRRDSECSYKSMVSGDVSAGSVFSITESISFRERNCVESNESLSMMKKLKMMVVRVVETTKSDISILRLRRAQIISLGNFFMYSSFLNFIMMVPFAMQAAGHTLQDSVWCISLMGVSNMVTRLLVSPLSDWKKFNKFFCHMFGVVLLGSSVFVFPFLTSITWLAVTMAVFGVGIGATVTLNSLIIIQFMGIENLPSTYGVSSLLTGIGFPIFGPLSGFVRDVTGSYAISIWVLAAMIFLCFILWLFMPAAVAYDNKRSQKERKQEPSDA
ncbi:monocarboxylate transporter 9-like [Homarus americanus]|uniref:monocarboxylate transporter 9-like n=1 Tax=Homarus americanus TaxID=6706 RepID=UPI001C43D0AF|nr:monocarboxylate transporter 9-like [Homarus americanus]